MYHFAHPVSGILFVKRSGGHKVALPRGCRSSIPSSSPLVFFFFQAEDGIRDYKVTGVQTCALPILENLAPTNSISFAPLRFGVGSGTFDTFDAGQAAFLLGQPSIATAPIVTIAEGGSDRKSVG